MALRHLLGCILLAGSSALSAAPAVDACAVAADRVLDVAASYLDTREATGRNDGAEVEHMLRMTGLPQGNPWCAAAVYTGLVEAGVRVPGGGRAYAWSPTWHPVERQVWTAKRGVNSKFQGKGGQQVRPADVFGLHYPNLGRLGHVGLVWADAGQFWITIEGNTNEAGSREGDGVYRKRRKKNQVTVISRWVC
jgi:hypothetical protein